MFNLFKKKETLEDDLNKLKVEILTRLRIPQSPYLHEQRHYLDFCLSILCAALYSLKLKQLLREEGWNGDETHFIYQDLEQKIYQACIRLVNNFFVEFVRTNRLLLTEKNNNELLTQSYFTTAFVRRKFDLWIKELQQTVTTRLVYTENKSLTKEGFIYFDYFKSLYATDIVPVADNCKMIAQYPDSELQNLTSIVGEISVCGFVLSVLFNVMTVSRNLLR